jgi:Mce-associated membrane protein
MDLDAEQAPSPESERQADLATPAPGRGLPLVAAALAVIFAVVAAVLAVLLAGQGEDGSDRLRETAGRFGEALVSYDYHDPDAHRDTVLGFATGSFRDEYEAAFDQGLAKVITEVKAVSRGHVKDVYLSAVDEDRAQAIVVVDIDHEGSGGPNTLYDVYFRLTLVKIGADWKVDQVTDLNFDDGGAVAPSSSTTTTTSGLPATSIP